MMRRMKTNRYLHSSGLIAVLALAVANVALAEVTQSFGVGARSHQERTSFSELPFKDGDLSYSAAYEYHDGDAFWQLACDVTPGLDGSGTNAADYAITPQLNLLLKDKMLQGGVGILSTYTHGEEDGDWTDLYWQFILGVSLPLPGSLSVEINAYYVFESWDNIGEFDFGDIEYGAFLNYKF
jgi:hypothetical protein